MRPANNPVEQIATNSSFEQLLEAASDAMVGGSEKGKIYLINTQTEGFFEYGRDELLGGAVEVLTPGCVRGLYPTHRAVETMFVRRRADLDPGLLDCFIENIDATGEASSVEAKQGR